LQGFNLSYGRPSIEDIEFGYRLRRVGYNIRLEKSLQVKHLKRWTGWSLVRTDFLNRALPWSLLILREGRSTDRQPDIRCVVASCLLRFRCFGCSLFFPERTALQVVPS
jgi:GT2 family glycosyltransferase